MKNAEFTQLITALRDLDHHQRKRLGAAFKQPSDEANVLDLIKACFEALRAKAPVHTAPPQWLGGPVVTGSIRLQLGNSQPPAAILPWARATRHHTRRRPSSNGDNRAWRFFWPFPRSTRRSMHPLSMSLTLSPTTPLTRNPAA